MKRDKVLFVKSALLAVVLASLTGCSPSPVVEEDIGDSKMPELVALRQKSGRLEKENKKLTIENAILKDHDKALSLRVKKLTEKCNLLQLEVDRRTAQVKVLQDVPAQRDRYKIEARKYKARVEMLEKKLREKQDVD